MGISGLHKELRPYSRLISLQEYMGKRVGVDAYAWLHRGCCACATELATGNYWWIEKHTIPPYVDFCLKMVTMLCQCGIIPVLVFDGGALPAKEGTRADRAAHRSAAKQEGLALHSAGQTEVAAKRLAQAVNLTPAMAHEVVMALRHIGIEYIVAPYEADSQLAYLSLLDQARGGVAAVITEDSDLVAYGCTTVLFKAERQGATAQQLQIGDLWTCTTVATDAAATAKVLGFATFTLEMLQATCVLAGCDFLPSIKGIGFRKAHALIKQWRSLPRVFGQLKRDGRLPEGYADAAQRAVWNFRHALVFDAREGQLGRQLPMQPLPPELAGQDIAFLGMPRPAHIAQGIACGRLHPMPPHAAFADLAADKQPQLGSSKGGDVALQDHSSHGGVSTWMRSAGNRSADSTPQLAQLATSVLSQGSLGSSQAHTSQRGATRPLHGLGRSGQQLPASKRRCRGPAASFCKQQASPAARLLHRLSSATCSAAAACQSRVALSSQAQSSSSSSGRRQVPMQAAAPFNAADQGVVSVGAAGCASPAAAAEPLQVAACLDDLHDSATQADGAFAAATGAQRQITHPVLHPLAPNADLVLARKLAARQALSQHWLQKQAEQQHSPVAPATAAVRKAAVSKAQAPYSRKHALPRSSIHSFFKPIDSSTTPPG